jgi:hypothetical protein
MVSNVPSAVNGLSALRLVVVLVDGWLAVSECEVNEQTRTH